MDALDGWDQKGEPPAALISALAHQEAAIAELGDTPQAHLRRLRHASFVAQLLGPEPAWATIETIPSDSPAWAAYAPWWQELAWFLRDVEAARERFAEVQEQVPDPGLQSAFRAADLLAAERSGDETALARTVTSATEVEGPLEIGEPMPRFVLRDHDLRSEIRSEELQGPYLIEVWSTWCSPCIENMAQLHALHERAPTLTILSVAINDTLIPVTEFRRERWPMPWTNAWVPGGELLFAGWGRDAVAVPFVVLVDGDGRVVEAGPHLSGDPLDLLR
jgi:hypothetical protein